MPNILSLLIIFLVHAFVIFIGARVANVERATYIKCFATAVVSYILLAIFNYATSLLVLVRPLEIVIGAVILLLATALAARWVLKANWVASWVIAIVTAILNAILNWFLQLQV